MKFKYLIPIILLVVISSAFINREKTARLFVSYFENVLGTSLELKFKAVKAEDAASAETNALNEIDRLDQVLSAYKNNSGFNAWMRGCKKTIKISADLFEVLKQFLMAPVIVPMPSLIEKVGNMS